MRRKGFHSEISLFAFQDIMASIIGMVFFIVIIIAMDITVPKQTTAQVQTPDLEGFTEPQLADRIRSLHQEIEQHKEKILSLNRRLQVASSHDEGTVVADLERLNLELQSKYREIESIQKDVEKTEKAILDANAAKTKSLQEKEQLAKDIDKLKGRLKEVAEAPRVGYIIDDHPDKLEPWLVEVTSKKIRVSSREKTGSALEFHAEDEAERAKQFISWATGQDSRKRYFVFLVKPSGLAIVRKLMEAIQKAGFEVGQDFLPEAWIPF
jgi:cell division septum initiation protein DivIVA